MIHGELKRLKMIIQYMYDAKTKEGAGVLLLVANRCIEGIEKSIEVSPKEFQRCHRSEKICKRQLQNLALRVLEEGGLYDT